MSIDSINNYGTSGASNASGSTSGTTGKNTLDMDDFFKLMVAQLANQDMYNTVDDTEFMAQMTQFSMVQALSDMSTLSATAYSVSLIGKEVILAGTNADGTLNTYKGIVEGVNLFNGSAEIVVDGVAFPLSRVMQVKEPDIIIPGDGINDPDPEEDDDEAPVDETNNDANSVNETEGSDSTGGTNDSGETDGGGGTDESGGTEGGGDV
ncbi:MAG TPA: flagellar hook capping FlgD N-terminal domain-containing protein [Anaerovoracaceae bacterium]|nr:flagellar hook capping FlgD N-terminal domain-containing protein [Anaerovoracaceae bacterium]